MSPILVIAVTAAAILAAPAGSFAQSPSAAAAETRKIESRSGSIAPEVPAASAAFEAPGMRSGRAGRQAKRSGVNPTALGAVIGAAAAAGITAWAAASYGENEGGGFCARCCLQWSVVSVPVGAGIGAAVGWGIGRTRRSVSAMPMWTPRSAGVLVSASF